MWKLVLVLVCAEKVWGEHACHWNINHDGHGESEIAIGSFDTPQECASKCTEKKTLNPKINGATVRKSDGKCWCEIGMNQEVTSDVYDTCYLLQDNCQQTEGGNDGGACCGSPFIYKGQQHHKCIDIGYPTFWCPTTGNYDTDGKWGVCKFGDTGCVATEGGNSNGAGCHFPFTYRGQQMNSCIKTRHNRLWCATTANYDTEWKWANCLPEKSACACKPCKNGGSCKNEGDSYKCSCEDGFMGTNCELKDMCSSLKPCKNGASCTNTNTGYSCQCKTGFTGTNCENDVNECATNNPCRNGGECVNIEGGYDCVCPSGYNGKNCESDVNECSTLRPCRNGGQCINTAGSYTCRCNNGFGGRNCEKGPVYRVFNMRKRRNAAANYCRMIRGRLATIRNQHQNDQIRNEAFRKGVKILWIGLNDQSREGNYQWDGGDNSGYRRWDGPEPNGGRKENCVEYLRRSGNWNDKPCNVARGFACEVPGS